MIGKVVNIRKESCDIYIGRPSKWGSPYKIGKDGTRIEVLEKYRIYLYVSGLIDDIHELYGKTLGCWCVPNRCHGHVLLEELLWHLQNEQ